MTWRKKPKSFMGETSSQGVARARYERDELLAISRCSGPPNFATSFPAVSRQRGTSILP